MLGRFLFFVFCFLVLGSVSVNAQFFDEGAKNVESVFVEPSAQSQKKIRDNIRATVSAADVKEPSKNSLQKTEADKTENLSPFNYSSVEKAASEPIKPVILMDKNNKRIYDEALFITMKNFNVYRTPSRQVRCSVRFSIVSTFKEKVSNVSYQLKWPEISTKLSFDNIKPNIEYYIDYLLMGNGCYTMDKSPNVIVNRCRVKGKTQQDCASSIRWITRGI